MKVVSITPDIDSGGAAKSLFVLSRALVEQGHSLHIMSIAKPSRTKRKVEELRAMGVEVSYFNVPYLPIQIVACPIPFWRNIARAVSRSEEFRNFAAAVKSYGPDVIHYNSYVTVLLSAILKGYPSVLHAREVLVEPSWTNGVLKRIIRSRIHEIIAISAREKEQAEQFFSLPVTTIFNSPLLPPAYEEPFPDTTTRYGVFSHVTPFKGQLDLVKACALASYRLRDADVQVNIFGGTIPFHQEYYNEILKQIKDNTLEDIVFMRGFTDQPEEEMRQSHLVIRPDTTGHPWGRDVIECMSMGRPILASGTSQTFITPGCTGELFSPGDIPALADALVALADRRLLERMGKAAFEFAQQNFDPEKNTGATIKVLERVAANS